jgi:hypothetical protein
MQEEGKICILLDPASPNKKGSRSNRAPRIVDNS